MVFHCVKAFDQMRIAIIRLLDSKAYSFFAIFMIFFSVLNWTVKELYTEQIFFSIQVLELLELSILAIFSAEFALRAISSERLTSYVLTRDGIIDLVAIAPSFLFVTTGLGIDSIWIRLLRLGRLFRVFKLTQYGGTVGGIAGNCLPLVSMALLLKVVVIAFEQNEWWVIDSSINILIGVSGFSIAILMGSKLSTVNGRLHDLEDAACRVTGGIRDMWWTNASIRPVLARWSTELEQFLLESRDKKVVLAPGMRGLTDDLEASLEKLNIGGPNTSGFHRDAAFLIHRATAATPYAYNQFLKYVSILYVLILVISIPGIVGLISTTLSTFVIAGIYILVSDMDDPLSFEEESFISARLDALRYWNEKHGFDELTKTKSG